MYQKYQTDTLVLGHREYGESDRVYTLFTREFGLVRARASAVRSEKSKMRYALQSCTRADVRLVRGRRGWRLAGATVQSGAQSDPRGVAAFARIAELTKRLVQGEEQNAQLFDIIAGAHTALAQTPLEAAATIEIVCVARLLHTLGYLSPEALETTLFTHTTYGNEHLLEAAIHKDSLLSSINRAIGETQL